MVIHKADMIDSCQEKKVIRHPFLKVVQKEVCYLDFSRSLEEAGSLETTVVHSDIRGLVTA